MKQISLKNDMKNHIFIFRSIYLERLEISVKVLLDLNKDYLNTMVYKLFAKYAYIGVSVSETWKAWEPLSGIEVFIDTILWKSFVFSFIGFHLGNKVDEVFWFAEKLKRFSVNQISKFILYLDTKFNWIETI